MERSHLIPIIVSLLITGNVSVSQSQSLHVYMAASSEVVGPGDDITYTVMVSNTGGSDLTGISVAIALPENITGFNEPPGVDCPSISCSPNDVAVWTVGKLLPGESRTTFYRTRIAGNAPETSIESSATATAGNATTAEATLKVSIDPTPLLRLSVAPSSGPAVPGEPLTYTITYGNIGDASPANVVLTMPIPDGATFKSASGGGIASEGVVTWDLGLFGSQTGGEVRLVVDVDDGLSNGDVLSAVAQIDPNDDLEYVVRSSATTPVLAGSPLRIEYSVSQTNAGPNHQIIYSFTAANTRYFSPSSACHPSFRASGALKLKYVVAVC